MHKSRIIIIGAGAAGLAAAGELVEHAEVVVIEAQDEPGGRIRSFPISTGEGAVEAGAEFIHGELPVTEELIKKAGLTKVKLSGRMLRKEGNNWIEQEDMIEGWDELLEKMKGQPAEKTLQEFISENFSGDRYQGLRRHIRQFAQGFDLADPSQVTVQSLYREWSSEDEQYRIKEGYAAMVNYLYRDLVEKGCRFNFGDPVKQIDWQTDEVMVYTASGQKFSGNKLILTVPVGVMVSLNGPCAINMTPPADEYIQAYRNIGFGSVIKVVFDFRRKLWSDNTGFIFSDETIPTWWTHYPLENNLLTGWAGGPVAKQLQSRTDHELAEVGIASLANIFNLDRNELRNNLSKYYVFNWLKSDTALGAYSYSTPTSRSARQQLKIPLSETVFFAGEGLFEGDYPGTVEAAFSNGRDTAAQLLKTLK